MANSINIVIAAKDQASSVIEGLANNADKNMNSMAQSVETGLKRASVVMGGVGIGLTAYAKTANNYMVQTVGNAKSLARQTGDTVENASRLDYALQHMGISADQTSTVFNTFSKQIKATNDESADAALKQATLNNKIKATTEQITELTTEQKKNGDDSGQLQTKIDGLRLSIQGYQKDLSSTSTPLDDLAIKTKNADGSIRPFSDILFDVADKFKSMPDGVTKTNDALQLFGKQGGEMVKILDKGSDGIKALMDQADKLGITITDKNIVAVDKYIQSQKDLTDSTNSLKMQVGQLTAPVMARFNAALNDMIKKFVSSSGPMGDFLTYVLAFGGPFFTAASGVATFGANLAGAIPMLTKFTKAGSGIAAAEGLTAVAGEAALLPALLNPVTVSIAAIAATAGIGYLAWKTYKKHTDDAAESLGNLGRITQKGSGFATSMELVTAAHQNQKHAEDQALDSITALTKVTYDHKAALEALAPKSQSVADAQNNVKQAMDIYGQNSPQYEAALQNLHDRQSDLNDAKYRELELNLQLTPANTDLSKSRDVLASSTQTLFAAQDFLNNGLDGSLGRIAQFGPTALNQVDAVGKLQGSVATLAGSWDTFNNAFQTQDDYVSRRLEGNTYTAQQLQNTITNINKSAGVQFTGSGTGLQGGRGVNGFAEGTDYAPGGVALVGERGPELVNLPRGSQVIPSQRTSQLMKPKGDINQTNVFNIYNNVDMQAANRELGWTLAHA